MGAKFRPMKKFILFRGGMRVRTVLAADVNDALELGQQLHPGQQLEARQERPRAKKGGRT